MGSSSVTGLGTYLFADNMSFDGTPRGGGLVSDGDLWIGSSTAPNVRKGSLASNGTIGIATGNGTITLSVTNPGFYLIDADTGSASPSSGTLNLKTGNSTLNCGSTVLFSATGNTVTLDVGDSSQNTMIGRGSGNLTLTSTQSTGTGFLTLNSLTSGVGNTAFGNGSIRFVTSGSENCGLGNSSLALVVSGSYSIGIGYTAGYSYTGSESSNICLNSSGVLSESNALHIGAGTGTGNQQLNKAFISGINGVTSSNETAVTINSSTDQLGVRTLTSTPTASAVSKWDANSNMSANSFIEGYRTTATAAATTTLVVGDAEQQYFTGSTTQTVVMPVTSTLVLGQAYTIVNNSSGVVTVQSSGANSIQAMAANTVLRLTVVNTGVTTAAGWNATYQSNTISSGGISTLNGNSGSATGSTVTISSTGEKTLLFTGSSATVSLATTDGSNNVCYGSGAGAFISGSSYNTLVGQQAGGHNSLTGGFNTMVGGQAGLAVSSGSNNCIFGLGTAGNTTTGSSNIIFGYGNSPLNGSNVLSIGKATGTGDGELNSAFIAGIQGITVTGTPVLISSADQLGIAVSSRKFKENITDMRDVSNQLKDLRPVNFTVNRKSAPGLEDATTDIQYGLIAEEVHDVMPYLCFYDKKGEPLGVKYDQLPVMLLAELQKSLKRIAVLEEKLGIA